MNDSFWQAAYIIAALCVVFSIKWLSSPVTARKGVLAGEF
jgi:NAD/NADP transhydrogenase beta subunit